MKFIAGLLIGMMAGVALGWGLAFVTLNFNFVVAAHATVGSEYTKPDLVPFFILFSVLTTVIFFGLLWRVPPIITEMVQEMAKEEMALERQKQ